MAQPRKLHLNPVTAAADFRFVNALHEIPVLGGFTSADAAQSRARIVEMVEQALAGPAVVLQPLVKIGLFENDPVVNARYLTVAVVGAGQNLAMIGLRSAGQRGQQVVTDRADIELVKHAAGRRR